MRMQRQRKQSLIKTGLRGAVSWESEGTHLIMLGSQYKSYSERNNRRAHTQLRIDSVPESLFGSTSGSKWRHYCHSVNYYGASTVIYPTPIVSSFWTR